MKRALIVVLVALVIAVAGSPSRAAVRECERINLRDYYQPTSDGLVLHAARETFLGCEGPKGGGKTRAVCADAILQASRLRGWRGMIFRQKEKTLLTSVIPTFWEVCKKELAEKIVTDWVPSRNEITFTNGSVLLFRGLSGIALQSEKAIQQYIEDLKSLELCWFDINECSQTRQEFLFALVQTLRHIPTGARAQDVVFRGIMETNPEPGWFHRKFIVGPIPADHRRIHFDPKNNPYLAPGYFDRFADMPQSWKRKYIDGLWIFTQEGDGWVYPQELVDMAFELDLPEDESVLASYGLDPAGQGADNAALARERGPRITIYAWEKTTGPELGWHVDDVTNAFGRAVINYDAGGLGAPNGEYLGKPRLDRDGVTRVAAHQVKAISTKRIPREPKKYVDCRTEMFWRLRIKMAQRKVSFAGNDKTLARLREQMLALRFEADKDGRPCVETKKVFKLRTGMSPDELESVIYADARPPGGMTVYS